MVVEPVTTSCSVRSRNCQSSITVASQVSKSLPCNLMDWTEALFDG